VGVYEKFGTTGFAQQGRWVIQVKGDQVSGTQKVYLATYVLP
jgi:hypothetical protein